MLSHRDPNNQNLQSPPAFPTPMPATPPKLPAIKPTLAATPPRMPAIPPRMPAMALRLPAIPPGMPAILLKLPAISPRLPAMTRLLPTMTQKMPATPTAQTTDPNKKARKHGQNGGNATVKECANAELKWDVTPHARSHSRFRRLPASSRHFRVGFHPRKAAGQGFSSGL